MWSAFESSGVLAPTGNNSQPDVFQMMWNNAFSSLAGPSTQMDESVLQKNLCASSLLQHALTILSRRDSSILSETQALPKLTGKAWYTFLWWAAYVGAVSIDFAVAICRWGLDLRIRWSTQGLSRPVRKGGRLFRWDHLPCKCTRNH